MLTKCRPVIQNVNDTGYKHGGIMRKELEIKNLDLDVVAKFLAKYILKNAPTLKPNKEQPRTYEGIKQEQNNYTTKQQNNSRTTTNL